MINDFKNKNYYQLLGVEQTASAEEIKSAYFRLAKKYHPDKDEKNEELFTYINKAYGTLSDRNERNNYDNFLTTQTNKRSSYSEDQGRQYDSYKHQSGFDSHGYSGSFFRTIFQGENDFNNFKDVGDIISLLFNQTDKQNNFFFEQNFNFFTEQEENSYKNMTKENILVNIEKSFLPFVTGFKTEITIDQKYFIHCSNKGCNCEGQYSLKKRTLSLQIPPILNAYTKTFLLEKLGNYYGIYRIKSDVELTINMKEFYVLNHFTLFRNDVFRTFIVEDFDADKTIVIEGLYSNYKHKFNLKNYKLTVDDFLCFKKFGLNKKGDFYVKLINRFSSHTHYDLNSGRVFEVKDEVIK